MYTRPMPPLGAAFLHYSIPLIRHRRARLRTPRRRQFRDRRDWRESATGRVTTTSRPQYRGATIEFLNHARGIDMEYTAAGSTQQEGARRPSVPAFAAGPADTWLGQPGVTSMPSKCQPETVSVSALSGSLRESFRSSPATRRSGVQRWRRSDTRFVLIDVTARQPSNQTYIRSSRRLVAASRGSKLAIASAD